MNAFQLPDRRFGRCQPWSKQRRLLQFDCSEAFYGGAAAGGKSQSLLMAALQYVHVPGYAALIVRKDRQRLRLPGGLISRAHEWLMSQTANKLSKGKGPKWNGEKDEWTFPTSGAPATITFGYLQTAKDKFRYAGSEFQFIGFDELTDFDEEDYLFLFSRLRRRSNIQVPLRLRSASNPGGAGHEWVKRRFVPETFAAAQASALWKDAAVFVPAQICDNPGVDEEEYRVSLSHLPFAWRERLIRGDWEVAEMGIVPGEHLRYYSRRGDLFQLLSPAGKSIVDFNSGALRTIATIDPAGSHEASAAANDSLNPRRSATAIQIWHISFAANVPYLILREAYHEHVIFNELLERIREIRREHDPDSLYIENEKFGLAALSMLKEEMPIRCVRTMGKSKIVRAAPLIKKLERGEVFFPEEKNQSPGVKRLISELLHWNGRDKSACDQIDAAAYAAQQCAESTRTIELLPIMVE